MAPSPDNFNMETTDCTDDIFSNWDSLMSNLRGNPFDICYKKRTAIKDSVKAALTFRTAVVWKNVIAFLVLHLLAIGGFFYWILRIKMLTVIWTLLIAVGSGFGITVGAHRLFTHRSFVASPMMRLILVLLFTMAGQNCLYVWVRDHRQHHRFSDTDADPHNVKRGFFYSHIGWLMMRKHPAVFEAGKHIDVSDLERDPIIMFQKRWYKSLYILFALAIPVLVPVALWGEVPVAAFLMCYVWRTVYILNITWLVNSWAHMFGTQPYDKSREARESRFVSFMTLGEGWHNFHHRYPWDYRASAGRAPLDMSTKVIEWAERCGWASGLRRAATITTATATAGPTVSTGNTAASATGEKTERMRRQA